MITRTDADNPASASIDESVSSLITKVVNCDDANAFALTDRTDAGNA